MIAPARNPARVSVAAVPPSPPAAPPFRKVELDLPGAGAGPEPMFLLALLYVFLYVSRLLELLPFLSPLRPALLMALVLLGVAALTGRLLNAVQSKITKLLIAFLAWGFLSAVFSQWKGGAAQEWFNVVKTFLMVLIVGAYAASPRHCLKIGYAAGYGFGFAAFQSLLSAGSVAGRLQIESGSGAATLGDPNFYCLYLLTGIPLLWMKAKHSNILIKGLTLAISLFALRTAVSTASRSGMIAFVIGMLFLFWHATARRKIQMVTAGIVLFGAIVSFAPPQIIERFTTIFEQKGEEWEQEAAVQSTDARLYLLRRSLVVTAHNPIFGVGMGMFQLGENRIAQDEGIRSAWHESHNMYTQVSSETGIPGLILFVTAIFTAFGRLSRLRQLALKHGAPEARDQIRDFTIYLQTSLLIVVVEGIFLNIPYAGPLWIVLGLTVCLELAWLRAIGKAKRELPLASVAGKAGAGPAFQVPVYGFSRQRT